MKKMRKLFRNCHKTPFIERYLLLKKSLGDILEFFSNNSKISRSLSVILILHFKNKITQRVGIN